MFEDGQIHIYIVEMLFTFITLFFGYIKTLNLKEAKLADAKEKLLLIIDSSVTEVYNEYVRGIKEGAEDGKLTTEEKLTARTMAFNTTKVQAQIAGINILKILGTTSLDYYINKSSEAQKSTLSNTGLSY